jgi:hypothetical protein
LGNLREEGQGASALGKGDRLPTLDWLSRATDLKTASAVPYRLLTRVAEMSTPAEPTGATDDGGNRLIEGDNLAALKALRPYYRGRVKCIYIDPPYNTRSAFTHYDDNLEHSQWLAMIYPRLELLRDLLADEGSIWVSIDGSCRQPTAPRQGSTFALTAPWELAAEPGPPPYPDKSPNTMTATHL